MALTLLNLALVQVIGLIRRHHCLRHRPFHHRLIGCIDIGARGHMPWYHSKCYFRYIYAPFQKEVRDRLMFFCKERDFLKETFFVYKLRRNWYDITSWKFITPGS